MKRLMILLAAVLTMAAAFSSCSKYDDTELRDSIKDLDEQVTDLEAAIEDVQNDVAELHELFTKLSQGLTVSSIVEIENGYVITFSDGQEVTLLNGTAGADFNAPQIVPIEEDGVWYWGYYDGTDYMFMTTADGKKIPVTSAIPRLRVNNG